MMYNYTNTAIALLVRMRLLSEDMGRHLSGELQSRIHTARYDDAFQMIDDLFTEIEKKGKKSLTEPWLKTINDLEKRITSLEKKINTKKDLTTKK